MNLDELVKQESIDLSGKDLRDEDLDVLVEVLQSSTVLKKLYLAGNRLTLADGKFTDALKKNGTLEYLALSYNNVGAEGAERVAEALKANKTLRELWLYENKIGHEGAKSLADAFMANNSLRVISLGGNNIGDEGAKYLAASFKNNQSIREIDLSWNKISDEGTECLAASLKDNHSIRKIYLDHNKITDDGAEKLAEMLEYNHLIEGIDLSSNPISDNITRRIEAMLNNPGRKKMQQLFATKEQENEEQKEEIKGKEAKIAEKDRENARLKKALAAKDNRFSALRAMLNPEDLTSEGEGERKRPRTENVAAKSSLAVLHEVKLEKAAVEADLEEARGDVVDSAREFAYAGTALLGLHQGQNLNV